MTPDWKAIAERIRVLELQPPSELDECYTAYARLESLLLKHGYTDYPQLRDATLLIAGEYHLSVQQAVRLLLSLPLIAGKHDIQAYWSTLTSDAASLRALTGIEASIGRISDFSQTMNEKGLRSVWSLSEAAERWAGEQNQQILDKHGFRSTQFRVDGIDGHDFNSARIVHAWLALSPLMLGWAQAASEKLRTRISLAATPTTIETSATVELVGRDLPRLYERVTGKQFGVSKVAEPQDPQAVRGVRDVTGVRFVRLCLEAMGLTALKPETVASYVKRCREADAGVH